MEVRDPEPVTPFEFVGESGLLRLRRYLPERPLAGTLPVVLVYPMIKRPYVLDLTPDRSVVRNLLEQGFTVYLTDWITPQSTDAGHGLDEYVNQDLVRAIDIACELEGQSAVSLVAFCCAGLLAAVYAAFHPESVGHLILCAPAFATDLPAGAALAEQITLTFGNVPAWLIGSVLNARMQNTYQVAFQLARDLGEPELADFDPESPVPLLRAIHPWIGSDVPLAGQLFRDVFGHALPNQNLLRGRMHVGGRRVEMADIRCPVLAIAGEHDALVPRECAVEFSREVGSEDASQISFPVGHLGLMLALAAQERLWPAVGNWLIDRGLRPLRASA